MNRTLAVSAVMAMGDLTPDQQRRIVDLIERIDLQPNAPRYAFLDPRLPVECAIEAQSWLQAVLPARRVP